jgi:hypothetical protein
LPPDLLRQGRLLLQGAGEGVRRVGQCAQAQFPKGLPVGGADGSDLHATSLPVRTADAHELANKTGREQMKQAGTGRDRELAKLLLRRTTVDLRLRGEKGLERLRA